MRLQNRFRRAWTVLIGAAVSFPMVPIEAASSRNPSLVYFGTYTGAKSRGIYVARFDSNTGKLSVPELAAETTNPSFLAVHPNGGFLYAIGELNDSRDRRAGAVRAFSISAESGKLTLLNQQSSGGSGPCHLAVDKLGRCVLVANYGSGSIAVLPIAADGRLSPAGATIQHHGSSVNSERQAGPHAHFITSDPDNRFVLACDLGLDEVLVYDFDAARSSLVAHAPPAANVKAGAGPRHLAFHPNSRTAYVISEIGSTLTVFAYDSRGGTLKELQTVSTLPKGFMGSSSCAEVQVHPSGKFVYGSNRGHDSIAIFAIAQKGGRLSCIGHQLSGGKTPRHFTFDPTGKWMLVENQDSSNIAIFEVNSRTGSLTPVGQPVEIGTPVCAVFVPTSS